MRLYVVERLVHSYAALCVKYITTNVIHWASGEGALRPPSIPRWPALRRSARAGGSPPEPPWRCAGRERRHRRTGRDLAAGTKAEKAAEDTERIMR